MVLILVCPKWRLYDDSVAIIKVALFSFIYSAIEQQNLLHHCTWAKLRWNPDFSVSVSLKLIGVRKKNFTLKKMEILPSSAFSP